MPKFEVTELVQTVNRIEVFAGSQEEVEENYFNGEYNNALDRCEQDISVVHCEVEEVKEREPFDYSVFTAKET